MAQIELCGQYYTLAKPTASTFRRIARLTGHPMSELSDRALVAAVAWVAVSADVGLDEAAGLLEKHIDSGGDVGVILEKITEAINKLHRQTIRRGGKMHEKTRAAFFKGV